MPMSQVMQQARPAARLGQGKPRRALRWRVAAAKWQAAGSASEGALKEVGGGPFLQRGCVHAGDGLI